MDTVNKHKFLPLSIAIIVLVIAGLIYFISFNKKVPTVVNDTADYSPLNTKVSFGTNFPPDFPPGIILEGKPLNSSGQVHTTTNKTQTAVSYFSDKTTPELAAMYEQNFISNGWNIKSKNISAVPAFFLVEKAGQELTLNFTPTPTKVLVTFSYEK
ncbi:MAG: hypothetical protein V4486_02930 [Patescibacteria group bacterium]